MTILMTRLLPTVDGLPYALYTAAQVREFDRLAIEKYEIPGRELMERAGAAAFDCLRAHWPRARRIAVVCGPGNNGGDGYVIARLAQVAGMQVVVWQLGDVQGLKDAALACREAFDGRVEPWDGQAIESVDVIVDALLGTGLERPVEGLWRAVIEAMNSAAAPVLAVDVPSGLSADTGAVMGVAAKAALTVSFIGLKQGLFTGDGPAVCGRVEFSALEVPARVYASQFLSASRLDMGKLDHLLPARDRSAHKGHFGHVLVVGGDYGYAGAAALAGEAAARTGAGLVSVATHPQHVAAIVGQRRELMVQGIENVDAFLPLLARASVVAIGPGLGQSDWSHVLLREVLASTLPLVMDADALTWLAANPQQRDHWVLTPHPGEAARLLATSSAAIQADRFSAVKQLQQRYGGVVVLKGAGSLVCDRDSRVAVNTSGNPGMASGGMGDVLTGVIAGLLAQGLGLDDAARLGVCLHGTAADEAARAGERGLLAGDLLPQLRRLANPEPR